MRSEPFRVLDLFSGIGGFSLGLERTGGFETVAFCEIDPFCRKVLRKHWPHVPICNDIKTMDAYRRSEAPGNGFIRGRSFSREDCSNVRSEPAVNVGCYPAQNKAAGQDCGATAQGADGNKKKALRGAQAVSIKSQEGNGGNASSNHGPRSGMPTVRFLRERHRSHNPSIEGRPDRARKSAAALSPMPPREIASGSLKEKGGYYGSLTDIGPIDVVCGGFP